MAVLTQSSDPVRQVDNTFLQTLLKIRKRDISIYQKDAAFIADGAGHLEDRTLNGPSPSRLRDKPKYLRQVMAEQVRCMSILSRKSMFCVGEC